MLGNPDQDEPWGASVDPDKRFKLKKCELQLIDPKIQTYFSEIAAIRDCGKALGEKEALGHTYAGFCYDMANEFVMPFTDEAEIDQALEVIEQFKLKHKSTNDDLVHAVGHCHIDTAWMWPYAETKRKIARSWSSQLQFMKDFDKFRFSASSAAHYWWLERHYPQLFRQV